MVTAYNVNPNKRLEIVKNDQYISVAKNFVSADMLSGFAMR